MQERAHWSYSKDIAMSVLSVENIRKSFRGDMGLRAREVLHGVSLSVEAGEIVGFLGPNGAGKTTTIKIIIGLMRPDAGRVMIFGTPVADRSVMACVGFLPETPYFFPHLTLREFLDFCGTMSGMERASRKPRIERVADMVGLHGSLASRLRGFSKGMIQRAGLAQAVLHDPDLLILDEPFSGLDPLGRIMVRDILVDLNARGKTIFFSSHILPDMEALCSRTCIIRDGVVVRTVGLDDLIRMGEGRVEVTARGCSAACLASIRPYVVSENAADEEVFLVVGKQRDVGEVIGRLCASGAEVIRVVNRHLSLERVFLNEVQRERMTEPAAEEEAPALVRA
jgi:ABC-2 type transport system ATP-binding protein